MMWRVVLALWLTAVVSLFALTAPRAQFNGCAAGFCSPVSSASYVGPGDITSGAIAFLSAGRAYNAAYAAITGSLADLVAAGNGAVVCTLKALTTGFVNLTSSACSGSTPAAACAAANGGSCKVTKLYDQTGTGNHVVQATLANMPALTFSAQNGLPCPAGTNNASMNLESAGTISQAAPYSITVVGEHTSSSIGRAISNDAQQTMGWTAANTATVNNGSTVSLTVADNAFHALLAVASATAPLFAADSSANTSTSSNGSQTLSSNIYFMSRGGAQGLLSGFVCEAGIWPADLNSSYQAMLANMRSASVGWNF